MWTVYLVECSDNTLYCGATNNLIKRINTHNAGKGAKYTRGRLPVVLIARRDELTKSDALKLEAAIKKVSRLKKKNVLMLEKLGSEKEKV